MNQQQPRFCALLFSKINPDAHVSTKINIYTFYKGGLGAIASRSQRDLKKMEDFPFSSNITYSSPVVLWIQISARGSGIIWHILSVPKYVNNYQPKINNFKDNKSRIVISFTNTNPLQNSMLVQK